MDREKKKSDRIDRKFIEQCDCHGIEVWTDTGWHPVVSSNKTIEYDVWKLELDNGMSLECADTHIVFNEWYEEVYVCDLSTGDIIIVDGGVARVVDVAYMGWSENMYDLSVDSRDNRYFTSGILSHNTTTLGLIALYLITFNPDYVVGVTSFTVGNVKDIINRVKYTYEHLVDWMKAPVKTYNTSTLEFTNNSIIYGQVTSENALRGRTNNLVIVDEYSFTNPFVAEEFYTAILPSLTADGEDSTTKAVFISTPNGTTGKFAEIWFGALVGDNGFIPHLVDHTKIAGRTKKFRDDMIGKLGINKYRQEYENAFLSDKGTLIDSLVLESIKTMEPLRESSGLKIYVDSFVGRTVAISVDPSEGVGNDNHVIQLVDLDTFEQIGVYANNTDNQHVLTQKLIDIISIIFKEGGREVYYGIENNAVGNGVLRLIESADNVYLDRATMISTTDDKGIIRKNGITMSVRTKGEGCAYLKQILETGSMRINDAATKIELQMFVQSGNTFKAERGAKDDRAMSLVVMMLMMLELVVYEDNVNNVVNNIEDEDDEVWGFTF